ncbi:MAG: hypothetical protein IPP97_02525 [Candidatus Obscuribacter sp.]|nr:hypothetical protein [Candidatus Obscuribacter sp.]MBP6591835.1 hypothetical protein [Candidatus Obscuribacter sp.]MBP7577068.1 hypothetical protein [Candidatus Obscuribacter sp.]
MDKLKNKAKATKRKTAIPLAAADAVCIITGFDAFGLSKANPSELVVETFPDILKTTPDEDHKKPLELVVDKVYLETQGHKAWKTLKQKLDQTRKELDQAKSDAAIVLIMLGLAQNAVGLQLERFAINLRDYRIKDNSGEQIEDKPIADKGPDLLRTIHDLRPIRDNVREAGYPCLISNHAGTFICNELYYHALTYQQKHDRIAACLFVHLPHGKDFARLGKEAKSKSIQKKFAAATKKSAQIALLRDGVAEVIESVTKQIL